jgi:hypothetical protein
MSQVTWLVQGSGGGSPIETLTGNSGGPVGPDGAFNINLLGSGDIDVVGNPGTNTLTWSLSGAIANQYPTDAGTAIPAGGILNVLGGPGSNAIINMNTTGAGNTVSVVLNDSILLPQTNAAGTQGVFALGSTDYVTDRFMHNYGQFNTFLGTRSGNLTLTAGVANNMTGVGFNALSSVTTATHGTAFGYRAAASLLTGSDTTAIGHTSLVSCTSGATNSAFAFNALANITTGSSNLGLGVSAGNQYTTENSNLVISNSGTVADANTMRIGTHGVASRQQNRCFVAGINGNTVANTLLVTINSATHQLGTTPVPTPKAVTSWTIIAASQTAVINSGYFCNNGGTLQLALPAASTIGDIIEVSNINNGTGIQFTQAVLQQIFIGNTSTTLGAAGTLTSTAVGDALKLVCEVANTTWRVVSVLGNWTPA